jgi:hypothetical protein
MNTALRDAMALVNLMDRFDADLDRVLPQYSKERVKEGNALTDLAYNLYCHDTTHQLIETFHMVLRGMLHSAFPSIIAPHPQSKIGFPGWELSDSYQLACDQGIIQKHRQINNRIRQEFFEKETGMISRVPSRSMSTWAVALGLGIAIVAGYFLKK